MVVGAVVGNPHAKASLPGLLGSAKKGLEDYAERLKEDVERRTWIASDLLDLANGWVVELVSRGKKKLHAGDSVHPGFDKLIDLEFLRGEAGQVVLTAKRYAVLRILNSLAAKGPLETGEVAELELGMDPEDKIKEKELGPKVNDLLNQAVEVAARRLYPVFNEARGKLLDNLRRFAGDQRGVDQVYPSLEREQSKRLETLRDQGDESANVYVLDAEALQLENGRRVWDFYYEDQVSNLPQLQFSDSRVQQVFSDTFTSLVGRSATNSLAKLQRVFDALREHAEGFLDPRIGGDATATDQDRKEGLTISEALELEVTYRALLMSNLDEVAASGGPAIRGIVARYNALPPGERIQLNDPIHRDYLRNKVKRVVNEKADLLCLYDESKDQQGGVRPDKVRLAVRHESFDSDLLDAALEGAGTGGIRWLSGGWNDPQAIIFYRAVLNIPTYVFGRMDAMKDRYYAFKNLAKRSKVLHIDKSWEDALPDLDPDTAQARHKQALVRDQIIHFAALHEVQEGGDGPALVLRREGAYYLKPPGVRAVGGEGELPGLVRLGASIADAVEALPGVLDSEKVKYRPYLQLIKAVQQGFVPEVLRKIIRLPFRWRGNRDELRTSYGSRPEDAQRRRLGDYTSAYELLTEALRNLRRRLQDVQKEMETMGDDLGAASLGLPPEQRTENLDQSLRFLVKFCDDWEAMENPEQAQTLPESFRSLFRPVDSRMLEQDLKRVLGARPGATPAPKAPPTAGKPEGSDS